MRSLLIIFKCNDAINNTTEKRIMKSLSDLVNNRDYSRKPVNAIAMSAMHLVTGYISSLYMTTVVSVQLCVDIKTCPPNA